jgi:hypothetical protein
MKYIHYFAKGIFIGASTSLLGGMSLSILVLSISLLSFYMDGWGGVPFSTTEKELVIAFTIGSCVMGIFIPFIPFILAGTCVAFITDHNKKINIKLLAIPLAIIALLISNLLFVYILGIKENHIFWVVSYTVLFGLPYLFMFVWRASKTIKIEEKDKV